MKTQPECLRCFTDDVYSAIRQLVPDKKEQIRIVRKALKYLSENYSLSEIPSYHITELHRIVKKESGISLPFEEHRKRSNEIGMLIAERIIREAESLKGLERFRHFAKWTLVANSLDTRTAGIGYTYNPDDYYNHLLSYLDKGIAVNQIDTLYETIKGIKEILYIHDNVGEIAIDKLLIIEIKNLGCRVISALRGGPITSDATLDDGSFVGLDRISDEIIMAGPDTLGISFKEMSKALRDALNKAELVIAKGQANYYVLSEHRSEIPGRVFCLFTTKCNPVARRFNLQGKNNIATFL